MSRHYSLYEIGFPDYSIDRKGNVYSRHKHYTGRKLSQRDRNGYLAVTLWNKGVKKTFNIHRLVATIFKKYNGRVQSINSELQVNHIDGDKYNNIVENIEWCTPKGNSSHRDDMNLQKRRYNEESNNWKITNREINAIKYLYVNTDLYQRQIAEAFSISQSHVCHIVNNKKRAIKHPKTNK